MSTVAQRIHHVPFAQDEQPPSASFSYPAMDSPHETENNLQLGESKIENLSSESQNNGSSYSKDPLAPNSDGSQQSGKSSEMEKNEASMDTSEISPQRTQSSLLLRLPLEVIDQILEEIFYDPTLDTYTALKTLRACLLLSRKTYWTVLQFLFRHIPIASPHAFETFRLELNDHPIKGRMVRTLDFSGFSVVGLNRSASDNDTIQMVTSDTILDVLNSTPNLQEFIVSENIQQNLDYRVLAKLFGGDLPHLQAIDFCGAFSSDFVNAMMKVMETYLQGTDRILHIERLSFHGCSTLPPLAFTVLLPRLPRLTRLDLSHTRVTDSALLSISQNVKLAHLHLTQTGLLTADGLMEFMLYHPAPRSLVSFALRMPAELPHPIDGDDISLFLENLPRNLQKLDIGGMSISDEHVQYLPTSLSYLAIYRTLMTAKGVDKVLDHCPSLFYIELEVKLTRNGRLNAMWKEYNRLFFGRDHGVKIIECSGRSIRSIPEQMNVLPGWHFLHGTSRRAWFVREEEYDRLAVKFGPVKTVSVGWRSAKINCATTVREDIRGVHWHYSFGR